MSTKKWTSVIIDGLLWLVFWYALSNVGCWVLDVVRNHLPHITITWGDGDNKSLENWVKQNMPGADHKAGIELFSQVASEIQSGELIGYNDTRSELLSFSEAISDEWLKFSSDLLEKIDKNNFKDQFLAATELICGHLPAVEVLANIGEISACDYQNNLEEIKENRVDPNKEESSNNPLVDPGDKGERFAHEGGEGGTDATRTTDTQSPEKTAQPTQRNRGYGYRWGWY